MGINEFIDDMIHLTEGEKFIKYWQLWLSLIVFLFLMGFAIQWWEGKR
jgi:hypothetical protein